MARLGKHSHVPSDLCREFWSWILSFLALGEFLVYMARTKQMGPTPLPPSGTKPNPLPPASTRQHKRTVARPSGGSGERRTKQKNNAHMENIEEKNVTCERHMDKPSL
ncbi:unnamed protein product [Ilex paraguariensis]|uniref:Uncharacterized protein n=1 Tax=Ilex paraguariensis TaxID=185542 RepID=A0ABC8RDA0_9AQUA